MRRISLKLIVNLPAESSKEKWFLYASAQSSAFYTASGIKENRKVDFSLLDNEFLQIRGQVLLNFIHHSNREERVSNHWWQGLGPSEGSPATWEKENDWVTEGESGEV